ncbi:Mur ligase family protein [Engelhardtia mirabilis]|uniref:UDP-N-acetylmuramoylalanine--D-glutamate ligase n=1 Tax=Engelhardtia mirabilis TaxID=2528011 RepID=A0A518BQK7_9BACT|nr:UDP-N-acetylmuramoylalanine--D-glutamate ligase MurD [Planctomycetes bacterium Pla133]QDV03579.1 UDP-N-acetylmuramoylalanine--D-glutamate ligase MurD [Planctomycetes bacterium Pla86]
MKHRRALVVGLGRFGGGLGATRWLAAQGARVTVTDPASAEDLAESVAALAPLVRSGAVELALGGHREADFEQAELVVANPAVRPDSPWLERARAAGARVTSEIGLFLERCPARVVGITGTQGKSSTTTFLTQLLAGNGFEARSGGNLGGSVLEGLEQLHAGQVIVLELSSYQLEALEHPPRLAQRASAVAVTNLLPDHLERHGTLEAYGAAKARVLELLGDDPEGLAWLPESGPCAEWSPVGPRVRRHGPGSSSGLHGARLVAAGQDFGALDDLGLAPFQGHNVALALALALDLGADPERLAAGLPHLTAPAHRREDLGGIAGRHVYDNGVSTTPDSTLAALEGLPRGATALIGGRSKGLDWLPLGQALASRGDRVVAFGADGGEVAAGLGAAGVPVETVATVGEAVARALALTPQGATILFSPACASFDAYANFAQRAADFRNHLDRLGRDDCTRD